MKEIAQSGQYTGAKKYLQQRDCPLEIPMECIRNLINVVDKSMDERCSLEELTEYVNMKQLPFEEGITTKMYEEARSGRGFVSKK